MNSSEACALRERDQHNGGARPTHTHCPCGGTGHGDSQSHRKEGRASGRFQLVCFEKALLIKGQWN